MVKYSTFKQSDIINWTYTPTNAQAIAVINEIEAKDGVLLNAQKLIIDKFWDSIYALNATESNFFNYGNVATSKLKLFAAYIGITPPSVYTNWANIAIPGSDKSVGRSTRTKQGLKVFDVLSYCASGLYGSDVNDDFGHGYYIKELTGDGASAGDNLGSHIQSYNEISPNKDNGGKVVFSCNGYSAPNSWPGTIPPDSFVCCQRNINAVDFYIDGILTESSAVTLSRTGNSFEFAIGIKGTFQCMAIWNKISRDTLKSFSLIVKKFVTDIRKIYSNNYDLYTLVNNGTYVPTTS